MEVRIVKRHHHLGDFYGPGKACVGGDSGIGISSKPADRQVFNDDASVKEEDKGRFVYKYRFRAPSA